VEESSEDQRRILVRLTYFGTNTLVFQKGSTMLLVDPHFSRPGVFSLLRKIHSDRERVTAGLRRAEVTNLKAVLLTHTHYDHALDAVEVIRQAGGVLLGSESAVNCAKGAGLPASNYRQINPGDTLTLGSFQIRIHPAQHIPFPAPLSWILPGKGIISEPLSPPTMFWAYAPGEVLALQVEQVLVFGSAACKPQAYQGLDVETVVLGIGGLELKSQAYLERLYQELVLNSGARLVLLSHWDNFFKPLDRPLKPLGLANHTVQKIKSMGEQYGQVVEKLQLGKVIEL
jgi:L-ascorbate metabolism protein UlaG (beta-lactamase superfamily)